MESYSWVLMIVVIDWMTLLRRVEEYSISCCANPIFTWTAIISPGLSCSPLAAKELRVAVARRRVGLGHR